MLDYEQSIKGLTVLEISLNLGIPEYLVRAALDEGAKTYADIHRIIWDYEEGY